MALNILREAYAAGKLQEGDTIAEATSGNTGIAFAALGRALGHPVSIFMPDWMSQERVKLIQSFGSVDRGGKTGLYRWRFANFVFCLRDKGASLPVVVSNPTNSVKPLQKPLRWQRKRLDRFRRAWFKSFGLCLVRRRGLEPLCLAALAPQASASANFATSA